MAIPCARRLRRRGGSSEQTVSVDRDALPAWAQPVTIAAAIDDEVAKFGNVGLEGRVGVRRVNPHAHRSCTLALVEL